MLLLQIDCCRLHFLELIFYNLTIVACSCETANSDGTACDETTGQCTCLDGFEGLTCDKGWCW